MKNGFIGMDRKNHSGEDINTSDVQSSSKILLHITLGFMQVGLNIVTSANCKSQLQFGQTNHYQLL
jgi:hypothetical protein